MARTCLTVVLAAGDGTRMVSDKPKALHPVAGLPMVAHVAAAAIAAGGEACAVVVGKGGKEIGEHLADRGDKVDLFEQAERLGTGHAVLAARGAIERGYDDVLVLFADTPLLRPATLVRMREQLAAGADVAVLGFETDRPDGYGRLIVTDGALQAIREHRDASAAERAITLCNGGIMALSGAHALTLLDALSNDNAKGEYYLTDIVEIAQSRKLKVVAHKAEETEILGINTRAQLAQAEAIWQARRRGELMDAGVSMVAPETVFLAHDTQIGRDTVIEPHVVFGPSVHIGSRATVKAFSHVEGAWIGDDCAIGPFARLRPGAILASGSKAGNFVEIKNATIGAGAKVNHLAYIGDAEIGEAVNVGAGTITCNYDGFAKHRTSVGAAAFIGSNSSLVAPVEIGRGAYVASGSVITEDVPAGTLAIGRGRQVNKDGRVAKMRERASKTKS